MGIKYDIKQYIASVKMSAKKRVLVEGKDDRSHIKNLIFAKLGDAKIEVDTAENIRGECGITAKNNRAKINQIYDVCKLSEQYKNLYFLCDREYLKFNIGNEIEDLMNDHENEGNLNWTIGHSLENYFIDSNLIVDAFSYLSGSEFKVSATEFFKEVLPSAIKLITVIALSARDIEQSTYPIGTIKWDDFYICEKKLTLDIDKWKLKETTKIAEKFIYCFNKYTSIIEHTDQLICSRICRGHTAILMLQRIFAACLYFVGKDKDEPLSQKSAKEFVNIKESAISNALSEAWIRMVKLENATYPSNLINSVA
ncbi:hypothetical protein TI10_08790 [Photorhabdus luminescens subsp. luminescens]|uniref:Uncharacterized protein n=2 Tax=Photorhabdus TaxID=29487 RepID=A0A1G5RGV9_PHOLU|nr:MULTISPECIES: DUF4435 domain-containing protein [Photorhabdus]KMW73197.1 hypothetical protein TI10_08790 [Photorhabdus luminescens subsp. luminescens]OCQ51515.1 hypothetical protein Ppb6_03245 [Photorhabdus australis subsp. thailandensis]SCZ72499.1 hypothetical protein SAMN02982990_04043 [Photorhabdus luminescens]